MKSKVVSSFLLGILFGCKTLNPQNPNEMEDVLQQNKNFIGLQYVVFNKTEILYSKAFGLSDIKQQKKMETNTRMMAYSMSKTYTAILVLLLAQENLIDLDAPVRDYLPLIPYPVSLKVRHLICQTSGIPNPMPLKWVHHTKEGFDSTSKLYELLAENADLEFEPGEKYAYSNLSYWLLEELIKKVTGKPFEDVMYEKLFNKAGLTESQISYEYKEDNVAKGYFSKNFFMKLVLPFLLKKSFIGSEEKDWQLIKPHILYSKGMGGIIASGESLAKVMTEIVRSHSKLLGAKTKKLLFDVQKDSTGKYLPMTYGFHVKFDENGSVNFYYKEGGGASFHSEIRYYPKNEIGTLVMANSNFFDVKEFLNDIDPYFLRKGDK
ncbi:MAG: beta-lactamase family protein [Spirochaetia bacterium]|nr:beta-lactamase family protein [Spirochaetia bacterium]